MKKEKALQWHQKIAMNRGEDWKKNLSQGKRHAALNPSVIKIARHKLGLDQATFAQKLDISVSTFGSIERGIQPVKLDKARVIAKMLKQPIDKIFKPAASDGTTRKKYLAILRNQSL